MAKTIDSWKIVIKGTGETVTGAEVAMSYATGSSVDSGVKSMHKAHAVPSPTFSKTVTDFVTDEIANIKVSEGIS